MRTSEKTRVGNVRVMEAIAIRDFRAIGKDELSYQNGAVLKVLCTEEEKHWYKAEQDGKEGLIPNNCIMMTDHSWYDGYITRENAKELLTKQPSISDQKE